MLKINAKIKVPLKHFKNTLDMTEDLLLNWRQAIRKCNIKCYGVGMKSATS